MWQYTHPKDKHQRQTIRNDQCVTAPPLIKLAASNLINVTNGMDRKSIILPTTITIIFILQQRQTITNDNGMTSSSIVRLVASKLITGTNDMGVRDVVAASVMFVVMLEL